MIEIRKCEPQDFDGIAALLGQLWPGKILDLAALRVVYERAIESERQFFLCAMSDGRAVGFGSLTVKSNLWNEGFVGYVDEMVVDAAHRGRGIGTQILDCLAEFAREKRCVRLELDSAFHRKDAHAFYERHGFHSRALLFTKTL